MGKSIRENDAGPRASRRSSIGRLLLAAGLAFAAASCSQPRSPAPTCRIQLVDATSDTGIRFVHDDGSSGQKYIVETVTAGLALFDYDGDGDEDIYFLNGAPLRGSKPGVTPTNALYRNEGGWKFTDVTEEAGVGDTGFGLGVAVADYDNDGDLDLYVNNYGPNVLYRNNGDGTFSAVTEIAGVGCGDKVGAGSCFLDIDRDGDLDLYVANYVKFTYENHLVIWEKGFPTYVSPRGYQPEPDVLYRNNGDGTFTDASEESGIGLHAGTGMGMVCGDFDNDGDTDIFVLNDVAANFLFVNDGTGRFEEAGLATGTAYNGNGDETGSMGVDCGDYDNDGWLDLMMTCYQNELPVLYRNLSDGTFEDVTVAANAGEGAYPYVNWGVGLVDFDNDGDKDIFLANGHLQDNVGLYDDSTDYEARNILLMNQGDGRFVNVSEQCGDGLLPALSSRGTGLDDLDGDGLVDAVILNSRRGPTILRNESRGGHWIQLRLRGTRTNRDAVGTQVRVTAGGRTWVDEVHSGRGYQSHYGLRLHVGLGVSNRIDRLEIRWLGGGVTVLENLPADRVVTVVQEGSGEGSDVQNSILPGKPSATRKVPDRQN
jgi:enediyne biosynthesis protein E4